MEEKSEKRPKLYFFVQNFWPIRKYEKELSLWHKIFAIVPRPVGYTDDAHVKTKYAWLAWVEVRVTYWASGTEPWAIEYRLPGSEEIFKCENRRFV